jgi:probable selenium-dependent hydroxylase accessory protein YqeC
MIIAIIGAGGKTTLGNTIGKNLAGLGRRVLFTTTTKIFMPAEHPVYLGPAQNIRALAPFMSAAHHALGNGKLEGYTPEGIRAIFRLGFFDDIIVEADGAARKPVKAPNETEPVYPSPVDLMIGVIGLDCIGQPVDDQHVHRAVLFSQVTQAAMGEPITPEHIVRLIGHPQGLFRHAPAGVPRVVLLNKIDAMDDKTRLQAESMVRQSPFPAMLTGYNVDWFCAFYKKYLDI